MMGMRTHASRAPPRSPCWGTPLSSRLVAIPFRLALSGHTAALTGATEMTVISPRLAQSGRTAALTGTTEINAISPGFVLSGHTAALTGANETTLLSPPLPSQPIDCI
jgi:hypothetical protein